MASGMKKQRTRGGNYLAILLELWPTLIFIMFLQPQPYQNNQLKSTLNSIAIWFDTDRIIICSNSSPKTFYKRLLNKSWLKAVVLKRKINDLNQIHILLKKKWKNHFGRKYLSQILGLKLYLLKTKLVSVENIHRPHLTSLSLNIPHNAILS